MWKILLFILGHIVAMVILFSQMNIYATFAGLVLLVEMWYIGKIFLIIVRNIDEINIFVNMSENILFLLESRKKAGEIEEIFKKLSLPHKEFINKFFPGF